jgi:hypothetical protein
LLRALLAFLAIASAGFPLWKLTHAGETMSVDAAEVVAVKDVPVRLTFSVAPKSLAVLHLGNVLWTQDAPGTEAERVLKMEYPKEGVDLQFKVEWPSADAPAALRVQLTDPDGNEHEHTVWGRGETLETITFP